jgi:hypothetical protein
VLTVLFFLRRLISVHEAPSSEASTVQLFGWPQLAFQTV